MGANQSSSSTRTPADEVIQYCGCKSRVYNNKYYSYYSIFWTPAIHTKGVSCNKYYRSFWTPAALRQLLNMIQNQNLMMQTVLNQPQQQQPLAPAMSKASGAPAPSGGAPWHNVPLPPPPSGGQPATVNPKSLHVSFWVVIFFVVVTGLIVPKTTR